MTAQAVPASDAGVRPSEVTMPIIVEPLKTSIRKTRTLSPINPQVTRGATGKSSGSSS